MVDLVSAKKEVHLCMPWVAFETSWQGRAAIGLLFRRSPSGFMNLKCVIDCAHKGLDMTWTVMLEQYNSLHILLEHPILASPHPTVQHLP
jgi:hypothetical protein